MSLTLYGDSQPTGYGDGAWKGTRGRRLSDFWGGFGFGFGGLGEQKEKALRSTFFLSFLLHVGYGLLWLFSRTGLPVCLPCMAAAVVTYRQMAWAMDGWMHEPWGLLSALAIQDKSFTRRWLLSRIVCFL